MSRMKNCLGKAIDEILNAQVLDEDMRQEIAGSLQRFLDRQDLPEDQAFDKLKFILRDARRDIYVAQVTGAARREKESQLAQRFGNVPEAERGTAIRNFLEQDMVLRNNDGASVHDHIRQLQAESAGKLHKLWGNLFNQLGNDTAFAKQFHQELLGVDTGNASARQMAKSYRDVVNPLLERLRKAGVYVGQQDNHAPRSHSFAKIQSDRDNWTEYLAKNLDRTEHPDPDAAAHRIYDHLRHGDQDDPQQAVISMKREIKFNTPEAEFEYMMRYGEDGYAQQTLHHVQMLAQRTALAETLGPSPNLTIKRMTESAGRAARRVRDEANRAGDRRTEKLAARSERQAGVADQLADSLTGNLARPDNQKMANYFSAARNWMGFTMLGKVGLLAATQDSAISMFRSRFHGPGFGVGTTRNLKHLVEVTGSRAAREWAKEQGLFMNAWHAASLGRFGSPFGQGENLRMMSARAATTTQRLSLANTMEQGLRSAFGLTVSRNMANNLNSNWGQLPGKYRRLLQNSGIDEARWDAIRRNATLDEELGTVNMDALPEDLRGLTRAFMFREVDSAVMHPGHYDRVILTAGQQAGTWSGEGVAAATQFFSWPIAFFRRAVAAEFQMGKSGFVGFSAGMMFAGAMATQAYSFTAGEPMFEWDSPELWMRTASRSGLFTPAGDIIMQSMKGNEPTFGPIASQGASVMQALGHAGTRAIDGDMDRALAPMARQFESLAVPNYFWSDFALTNRVMDTIMWEMDPQYMRNRERRWKQEGRQL